MSVQSSASLKRLNHLQCEMSVVYHEMSLSVGQSDSVIQILYTICDSGGESCLLHDICNLTGLPKQTINSAIRSLSRNIFYIWNQPVLEINASFWQKKENNWPQRRLEKSSLLKSNFEEWGSEEAEKFLALNERYLKCLRAELKRLKEETM